MRPPVADAPHGRIRQLLRSKTALVGKGGTLRPRRRLGVVPCAPAPSDEAAMRQDVRHCSAVTKPTRPVGQPEYESGE